MLDPGDIEGVTGNLNAIFSNRQITPQRHDAIRQDELVVALIRQYKIVPEKILLKTMLYGLLQLDACGQSAGKS